MLVLFAAACPKVGPSSSSSSSSSTCDAGPVPDGYASDACGVIHRERVVDCPASAPFPACDPASAAGQCAIDEDCAQGTVCTSASDGCICVEPPCASDADCGTGNVCLCGGVVGVARNGCVAAECRSDADCARGPCFAAHFAGTCCGQERDNFKLVCARDDDECHADSDCADAHCLFDESAGHLVCASTCTCD